MVHGQLRAKQNVLCDIEIKDLFYLCIKERFMPVISMFYGLIVTMYCPDTKQHKLPRIHVRYSGIEAVYEIPNGKLMEGSLPSNKEKLPQTL